MLQDRRKFSKHLGQLHYCISVDVCGFALLILLIEMFKFLPIFYYFFLGK